MTDRLAEGLRAAGIKVSKDEEAEEQQFLDNSRSIGSPIGGPSVRPAQLPLGSLDRGGLPAGALWGDTLRGIQRQISDPLWQQILESVRTPTERVQEELRRADMSGQLRQIQETLNLISRGGVLRDPSAARPPAPTPSATGDPSAAPESSEDRGSDDK